MMFRIAQLKELRHSLRRARAIAEELQLTHIAEVTHESITQVDKAIWELEAQTANTPTETKSRSRAKTNKESSE